MIKGYINYKRSVLFASFTLGFINAVIMALAKVSSSIFLYAFFISLFTGLIFFCCGFFSYRRRLMKLIAISENISSAHHDFPTPKNALEELYAEIIEKLYATMEEEAASMSLASSEQLEYYTMWLHQIKTPISALRLAINAPNRDKAMMESELFKTEQYVEMALQYARLKLIASDLVLKEYQLDDIVIGAVKKYSTLFIYKNLHVELHPSRIKLTTDSKWLSFIIEQALSNAVKYTKQGGVKIEFKENSLIIIDSGIGIRSEDIPRIFEKGYTGYNGRLDKRASGLGLYMSTKAAQALSIELKATSKLNEGTKFFLCFNRELISKEK